MVSKDNAKSLEALKDAVSNRIKILQSEAAALQRLLNAVNGYMATEPVIAKAAASNRAAAKKIVTKKRKYTKKSKFWAKKKRAAKK